MKYQISLFVLLVLFISCSKNFDPEEITGKWELVKLYPVNDVTKENDNVYTLEFKADNSIEAHLDVNICWSTYTLKDDNKISIEPFGCTKVCCDSDYAEEFIDIVAASTKITNKFGKMILERDKGKA